MRWIIKPEQVTALVDTREQLPLDLTPLRIEPATLPTGDYSVKGLEQLVAIERKSLPDLLTCCGRERERFSKEVQRLLAYPVSALVVESNWEEIERGQWRSQLQPSHVIGSLIAWTASGLPVILADNHERAGRIVARLLYLAARRRIQEAQTLLQEHST